MLDCVRKIGLQLFQRSTIIAGMVTSALDSCVPAASTPFVPSAAVMEPLIGSEELTNPGQIETLLASIDDVIFDCDGVLWHGEVVHITLRAPASVVVQYLCVLYS
jgi:hypothetical protein